MPAARSDQIGDILHSTFHAAQLLSYIYIYIYLLSARCFILSNRRIVLCHLYYAKESRVEASVATLRFIDTNVPRPEG